MIRSLILMLSHPLAITLDLIHNVHCIVTVPYGMYIVVYSWLSYRRDDSFAQQHWGHIYLLKDTIFSEFVSWSSVRFSIIFPTEVKLIIMMQGGLFYMILCWMLVCIMFVLHLYESIKKIYNPLNHIFCLDTVMVIFKWADQTYL